MAANDTNNAAGGTPAPKKPAVKVSVAAKGSGRGAKNAAPAPEGVEDDFAAKTDFFRLPPGTGRRLLHEITFG